MSKEQNNILTIYILFILALVMNIVPSTIISTLGFICLFIILIAIYVYRARSEKDSLRHSHMSFLIKSFWVSSLFLLVGMIIFLMWADHSVVLNAYDAMFQGTYLSEQQINEVLIAYLQQNLFIFILTLGPSVAYLFYRCYRGILLAKNNMNIPNPQNWF